MEVLAMIETRDVIAANSVQQRAALGWFDVEFTMYGCAYLEDGKMKYRVSPKSEDIYEFIDNSYLRNIYPSNVLTYTEKCQVSSGMREMIAQDIKRNLAKILQKEYSRDFFEFLYDLAEKTTTNTAEPILWEEAARLEGVFDIERLANLENLVNYSYSCKKISKTTYEALKQWIHEERKNTEVDFIGKDSLEKTFYGIAYEKDGTLKHLENAIKSYIYEKSYQLEMKGYLVSPIYSKYYWYNYQKNIADIRDLFLHDLSSTYHAAYMAQLKRIVGDKVMESTENRKQILEMVQSQYGELAAKTTMYYCTKWNI